MSDSRTYYPHIDGLRAIAVLSVVVYHFLPNLLPSGLLGVDVFFVISGFVVSASVTGFKGSFPQFLRDFYSRRFVRILPVLLAALWLTTIAATLFIPYLKFTDTALPAHFGLANFALNNQRANYFSPQTGFNPYTHLWSLGVEEQFYLAFPLTFYFWIAWPYLRKFVVLGYCGIIGLSLFSAFSMTDPSKTFYYPWPRAWELGLGVLTFQVTQVDEINAKLRSLADVRLFRVASELIILVLIWFLYQASDTPFPNLSTLAVVSITALLLAVFSWQDDGGAKSFLCLRPVRFIGLCSYAIYLFHWPVLVLAKWTAGLNFKSGLVCIVLIFILSVGSRYLIEIPAKSIRRNMRSSSILLAGLATLSISALFTYAVYSNQSILSLSPEVRNTTAFEKNTFNSECQVTSNTEFEDLVTFELKGKCPSGEKLPQLIVLGDSHAENYHGLLRKIRVDQGRPIYLYYHGGCTYLNLFQPLAAGTQECLTFFKSSLAGIKKTAKPGDILFLPGLRIDRLSDWFDLYSVEAKIPIKERPDQSKAIESSIEELRPLLAQGLKIVFEAPKPIFRAPIFRCSDWFQKENPVCKFGVKMNRSELLSYRAPVLAAMHEVKKRLNNAIEIFDPFETLCPSGNSDTCNAIQDQKFVFFDQDHLSVYGVLLLYPQFNQLLNGL